MKPLSIILLFSLVLLAAFLGSAPAPKQQVGPLPGGGYLLVSGWRVQPVGKQVPLDTLPMSTALSPDGKFLLILNAGYKPPSISVLDVESANEVNRFPVPDGWLGLAFSAKGDQVYVGGGSKGATYVLTFAGGKLQMDRTLPIVPNVTRNDRIFIGDVVVLPGGRQMLVTNLYQDSLARVDLASGAVEHIKTGPRPYRIALHPDGETFLVTSWATNSIVRHQLSDGRVLGTVPVGPHASDMLWDGKGRLFVAAANSNHVYVLDKSLKIVETINVAMTPRQPAGMTPSGLALGPDRGRLYVACSDANAVAVVDVSKPRSRVLGFIPTGWYPTAVRALPDGRVVILNGRGLRSYPNLHGPQPLRRPLEPGVGTREVEYVGRLQTGTASIVPPFGEKELAGWTKQVLANSPYRDSQLTDAGVPRGNPVPTRPGDRSPIQHVVYIIKENRTYDQMFGKLEKGNGDPSLVLFGENVTPNHHKLAREFILLDNFYVSADVSADGHNWSMAAIAPDYTQRVWQNGYGQRGVHRYMHGQEPAAAVPAGYLWTHVHAASLSMRNYGYLGVNIPGAPVKGRQLSNVLDPILKPVTDFDYRAYELDYPDVDRAHAFLRDLEKFESKGEWPRFILIRLGNDHTQGTTPGRRTPFSHVADNDYALGMIVEGITKSRFWPKTAIFVLEDDAQNGPDHVDSHRSPAFVISPYVQRGMVDSTMYNTTSMLRTMELILGVRPMTHFDAGSPAMWTCFQSKPDTRGYKAEPPRVSLEDRNPQVSATAARSAQMDFSEADLIDDDELNDILWRAIRGGEPPPPVRSYFSLTQ